MLDEQTRRIPARRVIFRPHLYLHSALLVLVAGISWWGDGAAFLILYTVVLVVTGFLIGGVHGAAFLRARFSGASQGTASREPPSRNDSFLPWRATQWLLRGLLVVLGATLLAGLIVGIVARSSEPIGSFPGGKLSGELVRHPVMDWSFLDEFEVVQLQVSPENPRSVNVHSFVHEGRLYVGADFYFPFKRWVHIATRDNRVTVRARGKLYRMQAVRISDPSEAAALRVELERRLAIWRGLDPDTAPGFQTEVWLFRLDRR
jgi:hypothetical protein